MAYNSYKKQELELKKFSYTAKVLEICDNGDAIVELPPELVEDLGWKIGDRLDMEAKHGKIYIKNIDNLDRNKSLDKTA